MRGGVGRRDRCAVHAGPRLQRGRPGRGRHERGHDFVGPLRRGPRDGRGRSLQQERARRAAVAGRARHRRHPRPSGRRGGDAPAAAPVVNRPFVLATANPDKAREIIEILGDALKLEPRPPAIPDVEETGDTLLDNARMKALAIAQATGLPALADDTGLEVEALGGAPGVHTARFAGQGATYAENVARLLTELTGKMEPGSRR